MATALRTSSVDEMMDALADERRRRLLFELLENGGRTELRASRPAAGARDAESPVEMQHVHLPKLEGYDLVEWDRATDAVTTGPAFDEIRPLLEVMRDHEAELPIDCP